MTTSGEFGNDPDLVASVWHKAEEFKAARATLSQVEGELTLLLLKLEESSTPVVELLKICNEPLLIAHVLKQGRYADVNTGNRRSFIEIYSRVVEIAKGIDTNPTGREGNG